MTVKKIDMAKVRALIGFVPHEKQWEVLRNKTRFTTLCWGRRSGKTVLAAYLALEYILTSNHNVWIVAPTYDLARRSWDYLMQWIPRINKEIGQFIKVNKSTYSLETYSGSKLELKTSDNPASLLGIGLDLLIIDEAALVPEEIWRRNLRPTLVDRGGKALIISTPYGKNWFYDMMLKGINQDKEYDDYSYFHMRTVENETLHDVKNEMVKAQREMSANDFLQEHEAQFIDGAGSVFRGVRDVLYPVEFTEFPFYAEPFNNNHVYQGGLDLARLVDFTVQTIVDKAQEKFKVVSIDRFNELDWKIQKVRLVEHSLRYGSPLIAGERNNIGDNVLQDLPGNYEPFNTTNSSKKDIINNLAILIEQKKILIPNIPVLVHELEAYSYQVSSNGNIVYNAPTGLHDDMVMSLALAVKDLKNPIATPSAEIFTMPTAVRQDTF